MVLTIALSQDQTMSTNLFPAFTPHEHARLERLRERYIAGRWPRPVRETSRSAHYPVEMTFTRRINGEAAEFDCLLMHAAPEHAMAPIRVRFLSPRASDPAPSADEVLRWLAMGAIPADVATGDHLELMFYVMHSTRSSCWRGPSIDAPTTEEFRKIMGGYAQRVRQLLGPGAMAILINSLYDA